MSLINSFLDKQSEELLAKLNPIAERLKTETGDLSITKSSLALMLMQFLQFMEDVAGKNVRRHLIMIFFHAWFGIGCHAAHANKYSHCYRYVGDLQESAENSIENSTGLSS